MIASIREALSRERESVTVVVVLILLAATVFAGWTLSKKPQAASDSAVAAQSLPGSAPFTNESSTYKVTKSELQLDLRLPATVASDATIVISSPAISVVSEVIAEPGELVKKGDVLAVLDSSSARTRAEQAQLKMAAVAARIESLKTGAKTNPTYASDLRSASADASSAQMDYKLATADVQRSTINAPINGSIQSVFIVPGQNVSSGSQLFSMASAKYVIEASASQSDVFAISPNVTADVEFAAIPDKTFKGKVISIGVAIRPNDFAGSQLIPVQIGLPAGKYPFMRPGLRGVSVLISGSKKVLWVPKTSVIGGKTVFVANPNGQFVPREVTIGSSNETSVEIVTGLRVGESIARYQADVIGDQPSK